MMVHDYGVSFLVSSTPFALDPTNDVQWPNRPTGKEDT